MPRLRAALAAFVPALVLALCALAAVPAARAAEPVRVVFHVDENDPARMSMVLNNVRNLQAHYAAQDRPVEVEVVAYGPGLAMLRADVSPVKDRIAAMSLESDALTFSACGNTMEAMEKASGQPVPLVDEAVVTPSGVARLVELQSEGWIYIRP